MTLPCSNSKECMVLTSDVSAEAWKLSNRHSDVLDLFKVRHSLPQESYRDEDTISNDSYLSDFCLDGYRTPSPIRKRRFLKRRESPMFNINLRSHSYEEISMDLKHRDEIVNKSLPPPPINMDTLPTDTSDHFMPDEDSIQEFIMVPIMSPIEEDEMSETSEVSSHFSNVSCNSNSFQISLLDFPASSTPCNRKLESQKTTTYTTKVHEITHDVIILYNQKLAKKLSSAISRCISRSSTTSAVSIHSIIFQEASSTFIFSSDVIHRVQDAKLVLCIMKTKLRVPQCLLLLRGQIRRHISEDCPVLHNMACLQILSEDEFLWETPSYQVSTQPENSNFTSVSVKSWLFARLSEIGYFSVKSPNSVLRDFDLTSMISQEEAQLWYKSLTLSPHRQRTYSLEKMRKSVSLNDSVESVSNETSGRENFDKTFATVCRQISSHLGDLSNERAPVLNQSKVVVFASAACKSLSSFIINFLVSQGFNAAKYTDFRRNVSCSGRQSRTGSRGGRFSLTNLLGHYSVAQAIFDSLRACIEHCYMVVLITASNREYFHQRFHKTVLDLHSGGGMTHSRWRASKKLIVLSSDMALNGPDCLRPLLFLRLHSLDNSEEFREDHCKVIVNILKHEAALKCNASSLSI